MPLFASPTNPLFTSLLNLRETPPLLLLPLPSPPPKKSPDIISFIMAITVSKSDRETETSVSEDSVRLLGQPLEDADADEERKNYQSKAPIIAFQGSQAPPSIIQAKDGHETPVVCIFPPISNLELLQPGSAPIKLFFFALITVMVACTDFASSIAILPIQATHLRHRLSLRLHRRKRNH